VDYFLHLMKVLESLQNLKTYNYLLAYLFGYQPYDQFWNFNLLL
jgi:hypothetical protein